jgi:hypothetical protein
MFPTKLEKPFSVRSRPIKKASLITSIMSGSGIDATSDRIVGLVISSNSGPTCQIEEIDDYSTTTVALLKEAI